jgi:CRISPR-associated protein Csb2
MLSLSIELLDGTYRAAQPDGSAAEWPPHPERIFSALVQAWSDGGYDPTERQALEWLEQQAPPAIEADPLDRLSFRGMPTVYVPPNDQAGVWIDRFPERRRQARRFMAAVPIEPQVRLFWTEVPRPALQAALERLAPRVASVGHSASFVRASFQINIMPRADRLWRPDANGVVTIRVPHTRRLSNLEASFKRDDRPQSGAVQRYAVPGQAQAEPQVQSWFGGPDDWFVFEDDDGPFRPDILGFAHVAQRVRHALMQVAQQPPPEVISGHTGDRTPTARPHMAIVPLQNVGWLYSDGALLGFAAVLPHGLAADERSAALMALATLAGLDRELPGTKLHLTEANTWHLARSANPARASLRPSRWCATAHVWASTTPVLLDRFPAKDDPVAEAAILAAACRNIGLPEPSEIEIHKHSAVGGAESAYPARGNTARPDWSFPKGAKFAQRVRRHVVLRFAGAVTGPVILGAGRFAGFGLCLPLNHGSPR